MPSIPNYVKFQRGSIASYQQLTRKDENTLYFVYSNDDQTTGKLYLGSRLISNNIGGSGGATSLAELSDVLISEVGASNFLVSNSAGNWVAVSAADVAQTILAAGGNFVTIDENEFQFNSVDGKLELKGYANAAVGLIPVKSANGIEWQAKPADLSTAVGNLSDRLDTVETGLAAVDGKISTAISNAAHLKYEVIDNISEATETNVIYLLANNSSETDNAYDEYMLINNSIEKIGTYGIDLNNYVTTTQLNTAVGNLQTSLGDRIDALETVASNLNDTYVTKVEFNSTVGDLSSLSQYNNLDYTSASIADTFEDLYERLIWQEISE